MRKTMSSQDMRDNDTRLRRARAWIKRAKVATDHTSRFISYWIAFNALYSQREASERKGMSEKDMMKNFLEKIYIQKKHDFNAIFDKNGGLINELLALRQIFEGFWEKDCLWNKDICDEHEWQNKFAKLTKQLTQGAGEKRKLTEIFLRLYVVRNQIFHGSHSGGYRSRGYTQVRKGAKLLGLFVPRFCEIMEGRTKENWGPVCFRRQGERADDPKCPPPWFAEVE